MSQKSNTRIFVAIIFILAIGAGFFASQYKIKNLSFVPNFFKKDFTLGLDLRGGVRLLYRGDISKATDDPKEAMESLRDTIERRINLFGVSEPVVTVETKGSDYRLSVELAGIKDVQQAIHLIGETPFLEFREIKGALPKTEEEAKNVQFESTGLDGKFLKRASVAFDPNTNRPLISLEWNDEGAKLFAEVTKRNIGKPLAIFLDGVLLTAPTVQEEITGGRAQVTGQFTTAEAREMVRHLNSGALPVPITLISQQTVEASLGNEYLQKSLTAAIYGFLAVIIFMLFWYRLPGFIAVLALCIYASFTLTLFKLIPVTLTTAGIAGFILSLGMAVDANILVFEFMKEELKLGRTVQDAIREGFRRAWTSIRDSNVSSLITSLILYWFGTSVVKGFALTLALGILVSMFTALTMTRGLLLATFVPRLERLKGLYGSGLKKLI